MQLLTLFPSLPSETTTPILSHLLVIRCSLRPTSRNVHSRARQRSASEFRPDGREARLRPYPNFQTSTMLFTSNSLGCPVRVVLSAKPDTVALHAFLMSNYQWCGTGILYLSGAPGVSLAPIVLGGSRKREPSLLIRAPVLARTLATSNSNFNSYRIGGITM